MRWTDEVHVERTLQARAIAKRQLQGQDSEPVGSTVIARLLITTGMIPNKEVDASGFL